MQFSGRDSRERSGFAAAGASSVAVERWGRVEYAEALRRQLQLHDRRLRGEIPDTLVVVEHPPTFTLGRHAPREDVPLTEDDAAARGIAVVRSDRGGRATYHGPGQVVLYPIVSIAELGLGVRPWVCLLEEALLATLADHGIAAERRPATAGLWCAGGKIASLGLRIVRGVSYHGVALNTGLDASAFAAIVTCGVQGERVTTIAKETGRRPDDAEVAERLATHVALRLATHVAGRLSEAKRRSGDRRVEAVSPACTKDLTDKREPAHHVHKSPS